MVRVIANILESYSERNLTIGVLGTHSALEVCRGAKDEGLRTLVICQRGRERTYSKYYISRERFGRSVGIIDEVIVLDEFREIIDEGVQEEIRKRNTILIPHRGLCVYVGYEAIENSLRLPIFGNRYLLKVEERGGELNQYVLLERAGISHPRIFRSPDEIDRVLTMETDGIPVAYQIASILGKEVAVARKSKEIGVRKFIEIKQVFESGTYRYIYLHKDALRRGEYVLLADDIIRTGATIRALINLCKEARANVSSIFTVISIGKMHERLEEELGVPVISFMELAI